MKLGKPLKTGGRTGGVKRWTILGGDGEPRRTWAQQRGTGKAESWEQESDSTMLGQIGVRRDVEGRAMTAG